MARYPQPMRSRRRHMPLNNSLSLWMDRLALIILQIPSTACNPLILPKSTYPAPKSTHSSTSVSMPHWALVQHSSVSCLPLCSIPAPFARLGCFSKDSSSLWCMQRCGGMIRPLRVHSTWFHLMVSLTICLTRPHAQSFQQGEERGNLELAALELTELQDIETVDSSLASSLQAVNSSLATFAASILTVALVAALPPSRSPADCFYFPAWFSRCSSSPRLSLAMYIVYLPSAI
jgi:hypothetical protein